MSNTETPAVANNQQENEPQETILDTIDGIEFVELSFTEGPAKDLKFACPRGESIEALVKKYGESTILDIANAQIALSLRAKIKNGFLKGDPASQEIQNYFDNKRNTNGGVVFSLDEAKNWIPGSREITYNVAQKNATKARKAAEKATDPAEKAKFKKEQKYWMRLSVTILQKQLAEASAEGDE